MTWADVGVAAAFIVGVAVGGWITVGMFGAVEAYLRRKKSRDQQ